jgi:hypothetical protein
MGIGTLGSEELTNGAVGSEEMTSGTARSEETQRNSFAPSAIRTTELSEMTSGDGTPTETFERTTVTRVWARLIPSSEELPMIVKES